MGQPELAIITNTINALASSHIVLKSQVSCKTEMNNSY